MRCSCKIWLSIISLVILLAGTAQSQKTRTAEGPISRDRYLRQQLIAAGQSPPTPPKKGFFGTVIQLIWDQVNDTKSAYSQVSKIVGDSFVDENAPTEAPVNGTEAKPKLSRQELLRVLDRNLRGLQRLRALEWREAVQDSQKNIREYKQQASKGKNLITAR